MGSSFEDKRNALFASLTTAEQSIRGTALDQSQQQQQQQQSIVIDSNPDGRQPKKDISLKYHGRQSIFKRPAAPIDSCLKPRRVPDYKMNPHKWKKYSLEDSDISDKTNQAAAFAFLKEIEKRKETDGTNHNDETESTDGKKIQFKRMDRTKNITYKLSAGLKIADNDNAATAAVADDGGNDMKITFKGSKVIQPEYVIGQKPIKKVKRIKLAETERKNSSSADEKKCGKQSLKLDHLLDDEVDENSDDEMI